MATRPQLREVQLDDVLPLRRGVAYATMSAEQWDGLLRAAYDAGWVLLELDGDERPLRAYRRPQRAAPGNRG
jgi:hypothetical protein